MAPGSSTSMRRSQKTTKVGGIHEDANSGIPHGVLQRFQSPAIQRSDRIAARCLELSLWADHQRVGEPAADSVRAEVRVLIGGVEQITELRPTGPARGVETYFWFDGAGDGNRTHVRSLGSFYTAIVRRPLICSAAIIPQLIRCANTPRTNLTNGRVRPGFCGAGTPACAAFSDSKDTSACAVFAVSTPPGVAVPPDLVARLAADGYIKFLIS